MSEIIEKHRKKKNQTEVHKRFYLIQKKIEDLMG
jgi:hypothetical protein